ncbi:terminase large subunit [Kaustia mangrovi]|uniref:Terminase large subunit n=1 Tax=Kaustia mangrovi TaxID=2593653 RepID=A0A7S8HCQ1_9HYPH|nr:terminase large subunit [Kaustia mangrovi]QPC43498.1 terminase large subunit [Kaustia mangrovi]
MATRKTPTTSCSNKTPALDRVSAYAHDVLDGKVVAGPHVRNACRRHFDDLARGHERGLYWDDKAAAHVMRFFERGLKLNEGQFEGLPFKLHPSQAFKLGSLFGWKKADGTRRFRRAYIEEGKGNGKSPFAGGLGLYGLTADKEPGAQIYAAAATKDQANILFRDAVKMRNQSPALTKRTKTSGAAGKEFNIAHHKSQSFFRPLSKEAGKTGSGLRPHFALCDEVHEHPDRAIMEMLERGFKFRRQPLLAMITNSGSDRNSVCWEEHEHAVRVAAGTREPDEDYSYVGEVIDDDTFAFVCALDKDDDPLEDPSCWPKANPLLNTILTEDYLAGVVAQAKSSPGKRNGILRLHFCVWTEAHTSWITRDVLESVLADFDPDIEHAGKPIKAAGLDLSGTKDLTAAAFVIETGTAAVERTDGTVVDLPTYDAWIEAWTPGETLDARAEADHVPYRTWLDQGYLNATDGKRVRYDHVAARFAQLESERGIDLLAFDRYAYDKFQDELDEYGVEIRTVAHPQGGKRRAKPDPELVAEAKRAGEEPPQGLWMPGSIEELEALILEGRIRLRRNPVLISAIMGVSMETDPLLNNQWFSKAKSTLRMDPAVALAMAIGAATMQPVGGSSVYETRGILMV